MREIPPFSILAYFMPSTSALSLRLDDDERDNIFQRLEKMLFAPWSVKMGRRSGRQAPTMPNEDSTIGQYTVGVRRSFVRGESRVRIMQGWCGRYVHVISRSPAAVPGSFYYKCLGRSATNDIAVLKKVCGEEGGEPR